MMRRHARLLTMLFHADAAAPRCRVARHAAITYAADAACRRRAYC